MDRWLEHFARTNFIRSADTAHDLKTPLNVAVLNLELMRMRLRKLAAGAEDEKVAAYAASVELELRRMARIFDTFFLLSTPPKGEETPSIVDLAPIAREHDLSLTGRVLAHESRLRQAYKFFFEGAAKVLKDQQVTTTPGSVTVAGEPQIEDLELTKIFKFYYTDPEGNPDLSFAAARLVAETYGGEVTAVQDGDRIAITLSFPLV